MQFHRHQGSAGEVMKLARQVAGDNRILPLSRAMVEGVATCVKESGMKSGVQYLTALKLLHIEAGHEIQAWPKRSFDQCRKGLDRGRGPTTRALEVKLDPWAAD